MDPTIVTLTPQPVLTMRFEVAPSELGAKLAEVFPAVLRYTQAHGARVAGMPFSRYHGHDEARGVFEIEAGLPIDGPCAGDPAILATELPGGRAAKLVHVGPYDTLGESHDRLRAWVAAHHEARGAAWEVYVTDPGAEPDPAKWRTEIFLPIL